MDKWTNKWQWVAILMILSILSGCTLWYLSLNPQHVPVFLATTIIALGFVAVMAFCCLNTGNYLLRKCLNIMSNKERWEESFIVIIGWHFLLSLYVCISLPSCLTISTYRFAVHAPFCPSLLHRKFGCRRHLYRRFP